MSVISIAFRFGYLRYGLLILFVHDFSDIFADLLKVFNYLKLEGDKGLYLTETLFIANLVGWAFFRLWFFPRFIANGVVKSYRVWSLAVFDGETSLLGNEFLNHHLMIGESPTTSLSYVLLGIGLLLVLACMHLFWFYLFLRILRKLVRGVDSHEIGREEYEGDSDLESDLEEEKATRKLMKRK